MPQPNYTRGQCWMSESEPELGLGFIKEATAQQVHVVYPETRQERRYGRRTAPLKRMKWSVGDRISSHKGFSFTIESIDDRDGVLYYLGEDRVLPEFEISPRARTHGPLGRLTGGQLDSPIAFELRRQTLSHYNRISQSPVRGLLGPRVELIPHQVYVVSEVSTRALPRVLLADEVGLGKTIEAGWIAHQLFTTGRISNILVLAPHAMINQWFVEMHRRFNLGFRVPEAEHPDVEGDEIADLIIDESMLILSHEAMKSETVRDELTQTDWDLVIVDEAHRIEWSEEAPSPEYRALESLAAGSAGLLLLTATPEQLGVEGHFGRLHLLDPQRFSSLAKYLKEHEKYEAVAKKADKLLSAGKPTAELRELVDQYGTGRVYFRNSRRVVEAESYRFPQRVLKPHPLASKEERVRWLVKLVTAHPDDKFLLIAATRRTVETLDREIKEHSRIRTAVFHEGQSVIVRDRAAAYFADPEGARLMLSSEIGSEGRNFQFARHLVLFDLPEDTDLLEQRIGRLDRIGQAREFAVHVPYVTGTEEELLYRWYNEVFEIFTRPATGAAEIHRAHWPVTAKNIDATIKKARKEYEKRREELESGRDRLIEINSFDSTVALQRVELLKREEQADELQDFMGGVFSWVGVNEEDLDEDSFFIEPGDAMFIPTFPGLPDEGLRITYSRRKAIEREDLTLLSWDHPMVRQVMETILSQEFGNVTVTKWKEPRRPAVVECYFVLRAAAALEWYADEFFPPMPVRVVKDMLGKTVTNAFPIERMSVSRARITPDEWAASPVRPGLKALIDQATKDADKLAHAYREQALARMNERIDSEVARLRALAKKNGLVNEREIQWWLDRREQLEPAFKTSEVRLDSIRVVLPV